MFIDGQRLASQDKMKPAEKESQQHTTWVFNELKAPLNIIKIFNSEKYTVLIINMKCQERHKSI